MKPLFPALAILPMVCGLSACASLPWLPSFFRRDPPMQAAQMEADPVPRIIPATFVQRMPLQPVPISLTPVMLPKMAVTAQRAPKNPKARVAAANSAALQEPSSDGYMNAIQVYNFSEGALYRLYATPQEVSDIALQPGEALTAISAGDTARWVVGDTTSGSGRTKQVHVLAKPFAAGLKTNLVITTDRRSYHLELQSTKETFMAAVSWTYPQDTLIKQETTVAAQSAPTDSLGAIEDLHFGYTIAGDNVTWKPVRAFDDGTHVYIEFPNALSKGDAPPLFVSGPAGSHDLVNYRVHGTYYVVDQLFLKAELRYGQDHQQVVTIKRTAPLKVAAAPAGQYGSHD